MVLAAVVGTDSERLPPVGHDLLVQEVGYPPAAQAGDGADLHPLGEDIHRYKEVAVAISVIRKWTGAVHSPYLEGARALPHLVQLFTRCWQGPFALACGAGRETLHDVGVHAGPQEPLPQECQQLVPLTVPCLGMHVSD